MALTNTECIVTMVDTYEDAVPAAIKKGTMYCCRDSGVIYLDTLDNERVKLSNDIKMLPTENDRLLLTTYDSNKLYCVIQSGKLYAYSGGWIQLGGSGEGGVGSVSVFNNVYVTNGYLSFNDSKIKSTNTAVFEPDLSVIDLVSDISTVCYNGYIGINLTSDYPITGTIYLY